MGVFILYLGKREALTLPEVTLLLSGNARCREGFPGGSSG